VFSNGARIFRAINRESEDTLRKLKSSGFLQSDLKSGRIVSTEFVDPSAAGSIPDAPPNLDRFLEHERIDPITYPYEWSFGMLADAALLTIDLQEKLLSHGLSLKDATPFNVQFVRGRAVFIDVTSIEKPKRFDLWFALGQFQRTFLLPLLLVRHSGWDLRSYFQSRLDGRSLREIAASVGSLAKWHPRYLLDLTLPLLLESKAQRPTAPRNEPPDRGAEAQLFTLRRLRSKIEKLKRGRSAASAWASYTATCTYDQSAEASKRALIHTFLGEQKPATVLDLGCNTGEYSFLAAASGAQVISADGDHDAIELLYQKVKAQQANITPLILDISNPSPALGYLSRERDSFIARTRPDCVFALALIHHLLISANMSLDQIVELFAALSRRSLALEFVPRKDPMFQQLIRYRVDLYQEFNLDQCIRAFETRFRLIRQEPITGSPRTLLFLERKS
jgi:SAM-dependent methyltransferase